MAVLVFTLPWAGVYPALGCGRAGIQAGKTLLLHSQARCCVPSPSMHCCTPQPWLTQNFAAWEGTSTSQSCKCHSVSWQVLFPPGMSFCLCLAEAGRGIHTASKTPTHGNPTEFVFSVFFMQPRIYPPTGIFWIRQQPGFNSQRSSYWILFFYQFCNHQV